MPTPPPDISFPTLELPDAAAPTTPIGWLFPWTDGLAALRGKATDARAVSGAEDCRATAAAAMGMLSNRVERSEINPRRPHLHLEGRLRILQPRCGKAMKEVFRILHTFVPCPTPPGREGIPGAGDGEQRGLGAINGDGGAGRRGAVRRRSDWRRVLEAHAGLGSEVAMEVVKAAKAKYYKI